MYSFSQILSDVKDEQRRRRVVSVEFSDGINTHVAELQFALTVSDEQVKKAFKQYLAELNVEVTPITDIDYTEPTPADPDPDIVAFQDWTKDLQKLVAAKVGVALGVNVATAAQITALETAVENGLVKTDDRYIQALAGYANIL